MIEQVVHGDVLWRLSQGLRAQLAESLQSDVVGLAASTGQDPDELTYALLAALPMTRAQLASPPNVETMRSPVVSALQTAVNQDLRRSGTVAPGPTSIVGVNERALYIEPYGPWDPEWEIRIGKAVLERFAHGMHPFNNVPAEYVVTTDEFTVIVVGDWGSSHPRAQLVADAMREQVDNAADRSAVHVIHLGDVYYSGDPAEYRKNVLADGRWPLSLDDAAHGATSWSLNGNHDMYGGGWGYFDTLLSDPRFSHQTSNNQPTSWFRLRTPHCDLVGLDSSWSTNLFSTGSRGSLYGPQAKQVATWANELLDDDSDLAHKLMLFTHHQPMSVYSPHDADGVMPAQLAPVLEQGHVAAWMWGHEHRCMAFDNPTIDYPRCVGHGGIPQPAHKPGTNPPAPGIWELTESFTDLGGRWNKFGFAVLEFNGTDVSVRYVSDDRRTSKSETFQLT